MTVPSPGAYEALPIARRLAPELVAPEVSAPALADALRAGFALDGHRCAAYAQRAASAMEPYRRDSVMRTVSQQLLPALGLST